MTKVELILALYALYETKPRDVRYDTEMAHCEADELLLEYINDAEIRKAYESSPKWYA